MTEPGFLETLNSLFGGAVTTLIGAFTGRLMYHSGEVKLGRRRFFLARSSCGKSPLPSAWRLLARLLQVTLILASRCARVLWPRLPIWDRVGRRPDDGLAEPQEIAAARTAEHGRDHDE